MSQPRPASMMPAKPRPAPAGGRSARPATTPALTRDARQRASLGVLEPKRRPRVYPKGSTALRVAYRRAMAADAAWNEGDHPRAKNGQFGAGSAVHIVTTHDSDTGETTFHHVGSDPTAAAAAHADVGADDDIDFVPEYHTPKLKAAKGERTDAVRIVHSADEDGGAAIHGVHASYGAARAQAHDASSKEWEENGPRRSEAGLSELEKVGVAQAWNEKQEEDGDDVRVRVDADGDPVLDDDGELVFEQDGQEVELDEGRRAEFDDLSEEMYPGDEAAAYPGLEEANDHFEAEGRHEAVFKIHTHSAVAGARDSAASLTATDARLARAFDRLRVELSPHHRRPASARAVR